MTIYWVNADGTLNRATADNDAGPANTTKVTVPPSNGKEIWNGVAWTDPGNAIAWAAVREKRDRLLAASDWTQLADSSVDTALWAAHRQVLRDVPQVHVSPSDVIWPQRP